MVTPEEVMLNMIRAEIDKLPAQDKEQVQIAAEQLRQVVAGHGDSGNIALALVGCEAAVGESL